MLKVSLKLVFRTFIKTARLSISSSGRCWFSIQTEFSPSIKLDFPPWTKQSPLTCSGRDPRLSYPGECLHETLQHRLLSVWTQACHGVHTAQQAVNGVSL